jgi:hypothetical protein
MSEELPRYPHYSLIELLEAFTGLDASVYPDRAALILEQVKERYPEAWRVIGKRMGQAKVSNEAVPLKYWQGQLPDEVLAAGSHVGGEDEVQHFDSAPNYAAYSREELIQALTSINARDYPDRQAWIMDEIRRRFPDTLARARGIVGDKQK